MPSPPSSPGRRSRRTGCPVLPGNRVLRGMEVKSAGQLAIMFDSTQTSVNTAFIFGAFEFYPTQRVLLRSGRQVRIGSRARDVLLALLENAGAIVKKRTLIAR